MRFIFNRVVLFNPLCQPTSANISLSGTRCFWRRVSRYYTPKMIKLIITKLKKAVDIFVFGTLLFCLDDVLTDVSFVTDISRSWVWEGDNGFCGVLYTPQGWLPVVGWTTQIEGKFLCDPQIFVEIKWTEVERCVPPRNVRHISLSLVPCIQIGLTHANMYLSDPLVTNMWILEDDNKVIQLETTHQSSDTT